MNYRAYALDVIKLQKFKMAEAQRIVELEKEYTMAEALERLKQKIQQTKNQQQ